MQILEAATLEEKNLRNANTGVALNKRRCRECDWKGFLCVKTKQNQRKRKKTFVRSVTSHDRGL